jgi:hypothetical protein
VGKRAGRLVHQCGTRMSPRDTPSFVPCRQSTCLFWVAEQVGGAALDWAAGESRAGDAPCQDAKQYPTQGSWRLGFVGSCCEEGSHTLAVTQQRRRRAANGGDMLAACDKPGGF